MSNYCNVGNLEIVQGDKRNVQLTVRDEDGDPLELATYGLRFSVKGSIYDTDLKALITLTTDNSAEIQKLMGHTGKATIKLLPEHTVGADPGCYVYDIKLIEDSAQTTIGRGAFDLIPAVWRGE